MSPCLVFRNTFSSTLLADCMTFLALVLNLLYSVALFSVGHFLSALQAQVLSLTDLSHALFHHGTLLGFFFAGMHSYALSKTNALSHYSIHLLFFPIYALNKYQRIASSFPFCNQYLFCTSVNKRFPNLWDHGPLCTCP